MTGRHPPAHKEDGGVTFRNRERERSSTIVGTAITPYSPRSTMLETTTSAENFDFGVWEEDKSRRLQTFGFSSFKCQTGRRLTTKTLKEIDNHLTTPKKIICYTYDLHHVENVGFRLTFGCTE